MAVVSWRSRLRDGHRSDLWMHRPPSRMHVIPSRSPCRHHGAVLGSVSREPRTDNEAEDDCHRAMQHLEKHIVLAGWAGPSPALLIESDKHLYIRLA